MSGKIRLGVVGCGGILRNKLLPYAAALDEYEMAGFADISGENARMACEKFGGRYFTTDVNKVLDDGEIDAVVIGTLPDTHVSLSVQALEAGKHVFAQKPLAVTYEQCREIVAADCKAEKKLMTAYCYRLSPLTNRMREVITEPKVMYARMMSSDLTNDRLHYIQNPAYGAPMLELACHNADLVYWLARSKPVRVSAFGGNMRHPGMDVVDNFTVNYEFENGAVANLTSVDCGSGHFPTKWYTEVFGQGITAVNKYFRRLEITGKVAEEFECEYDTGIGIDRDMLVFRDCILNGRPSPIPASEGIVATVMINKAFESLDSGKVVDIDMSEFWGD